MSERDQARAPTLKRDWRFYAGMTALVLAVILPLGALIVPMLGLPLAQSALLVGVLVAGGPEVLCIAAIALLAYIYAYAPAAMPGGNTRIYILAAMALPWISTSG
jgi:hypothetical protein